MRTKYLLYVTFVLVISLLSVTPVLASNGEECSHVEHTIQSLRNCVAHAAEMGHINSQGVANSLLAKLDGAQAASERGKMQVAVAKLEAFIHHACTGSNPWLEPLM